MTLPCSCAVGLGVQLQQTEGDGPVDLHGRHTGWWACVWRTVGQVRLGNTFHLHSLITLFCPCTPKKQKLGEVRRMVFSGQTPFPCQTIAFSLSQSPRLNFLASQPRFSDPVLWLHSIKPGQMDFSEIHGLLTSAQSAKLRQRK